MATEYTCTGGEEVKDIELVDQDGNVANSIAASECFAEWVCQNYKEFGMYPTAESLTWRVRPPYDYYPPGATEPEPPPGWSDPNSGLP